MIPEQRTSTHPGEVLLEEFLVPLGRAAEDLALHVGVDATWLHGVIDGNCPADAPLAWSLAMALGTTPEFWLNLQAAHDLSRTRPKQVVPRLAG
ncbi:MAG: HigA family addiction module antitoxin [Tepidiformaceae bacterium]